MSKGCSLIINGPNLNLLGTREPEVYGTLTLSQLEQRCGSRAAAARADCLCFQSNHEGAIVDRIYAARGKVTGIVINAGALTHTSVAIRDALVGVDIPFVEVHITNVHAREAFRQHSYLASKAIAVIAGLSFGGYEAAIDRLLGQPEDAAA